jgi:hypothetical protein
MNRTLTITVATVVTLFAGHAAAGTNTPLVADHIGHWLNLEYRTGDLAPEIANSPRLIESILVIERSLEKVDTLLRERKTGGECLQLGLPYIRVKYKTSHEQNANGITVATTNKVRLREVLTVQVCSGVAQRSLIWELDGDLIIVTRPRLDTGAFSRTLYFVHQITAEERLRTGKRNARLAARNRDPKPPHAKMLYAPPIFNSEVRVTDPKLLAFGAEFSSPPAVRVDTHGQSCTDCGNGVDSGHIEH